MQILPGDIIAVHGIHWVSHEIEDVTHSRYSHIATAISDRFLVEAIWPRVTAPAPTAKYIGLADIYRISDATDKQREEMALYVQRQIGKRYSLRLILYEWLRYKFSIMPVYKGPDLICSLLEADTARIGAGLPFCQGIPYPAPVDVVHDPSVELVGAL